MSIGIELTDLGVRAVRVSDAGEVLARSERSPKAGRLGTTVREAIRDVRDGDRTLATGIATPWPNDPLPEDVASALAQERIEAVTLSAGGATVVAEAWCGAARGSEHVVALTLGEHVVAGALVAGTLLRGAHGSAGAIGWLAVNPVEREDYRRYGSLEAEVAAAGIVRRLVWRVKSGDASSVADEVGGDYSRITTEQIFAAARQGDGVSISVLRDTVRYVGMAVANLVTILDPEWVVLGGMLGTAGELMLDAIRQECGRRLRPSDAERLRIVASTLGADAVPIGAARAAQLRLP